MVNVLLSTDDAKDIREHVQQIETNAHCYEFVQGIVRKLNSLQGETDNHQEIKDSVLDFFRSAKSDMSWHAENVANTILGEPNRYSDEPKKFDDVYKTGDYAKRDIFSNLMTNLNIY